MPKTSSTTTNAISVPVLDQSAKSVNTIEIDKIYSKPELEIGFSQNFIHQSLLSYLDNLRQATSKVKTRAEVRGGGRKPWKQKGTGRARQGSTRSPQWRHGGVVAGPTGIQNWDKKMTLTVRKKILRYALLTMVKNNKVIVLESIPDKIDSTKKCRQFLSQYPLSHKNLLALDTTSLSLLPFVANLDTVNAKPLPTINALDLFKADILICTRVGFELLLDRIKYSR